MGFDTQVRSRHRPPGAREENGWSQDQLERAIHGEAEDRAGHTPEERPSLLGPDLPQDTLDVFRGDSRLPGGGLDLVEELLEFLRARGLESLEDNDVTFADNHEAHPGLEAEAIANLFWNDYLSPGGELCRRGAHHEMTPVLDLNGKIGLRPDAVKLEGA